MKVAFVVQRFGSEIGGGAELYCYHLARKMQKYWDIEVLTTCALDYMTWADHYQPGPQIVGSVKVRRFNVDFPRNVEYFNAISHVVLNVASDLALQQKWIREQGPISSQLQSYIRQHQGKYDLFFFFTYLYGTTSLLLPEVSDKAVLVPFAHDEPPFHLSIFEKLFNSAQGIIFNTPEEKVLVEKRLNRSLDGPMLGLGVDRPKDISGCHFKKTVIGHEDPYILYVGRIDESKGIGQLIQYFQTLKANSKWRNLRLILAGRTAMPIPAVEGLQYIGYVSDETKFNAMAGAEFIVLPSKYESLSISVLEAWSCRKAVLVNEVCDVLKGQVTRSSGGLYYSDEASFLKQANRLLDSSDFCAHLGLQGYQYFEANYDWAVITQKLVAYANELVERNPEKKSFHAEESR